MSRVEEDPELRAMTSVVEALERLDEATRSRVLNWTVARYTRAPSAGRPAIPTQLAQTGTPRGRPHSVSTERIIESLHAHAPATPLAIANRTGIDRDNVKSTLARLAKAGVVMREARGLYSPTSRALSSSRS